jgi:hypothetical protein
MATKAVKRAGHQVSEAASSIAEAATEVFQTGKTKTAEMAHDAGAATTRAYDYVAEKAGDAGHEIAKGAKYVGSEIGSGAEYLGKRVNEVIGEEKSK